MTKKENKVNNNYFYWLFSGVVFFVMGLVVLSGIFSPATAVQVYNSNQSSPSYRSTLVFQYQNILNTTCIKYIEIESQTSNWLLLPNSQLPGLIGWYNANYDTSYKVCR